VKAAAAVALLLVAGCGPSIPTLLRDHHHREAICAGFDGRASDRAQVAAALAAESELYLHVHVLTPDELLPVLVDQVSAVEVAGRADLVRVKVRTNVLPVDELEVEVTFRAEGSALGAAPASMETLAWATGETLPPPVRRRTYLTRRNVGRAVGAFFTGGMSLLFRPLSAEERLVDPPLEEYRRVAPRATALAERMIRPHCRDLGFPAAGNERSGTGRDCTGYYVIERPSGGSRVRLEVVERFRAARIGDEAERCEITSTTSIDLSSPESLGAATRRLFGTSMRRASEI
jgi:hypothetical protein